ncbi:unnamed protein product [[Candida] boidinii]|nr:unnamed protein product [[Candida] boidinii]
MQFFNLYIAVSLPFTNAIGGDHSSATVASGKEEKKNFMSSTATPTLTLKSTSDTSASSDLKDASSTFDDDANPDSSISNEKMTSFVEYSHYVAPELNITSIKSVFLPYAMTLGKSAFERSDGENALKLCWLKVMQELMRTSKILTENHLKMHQD